MGAIKGVRGTKFGSELYLRVKTPRALSGTVDDAISNRSSVKGSVRCVVSAALKRVLFAAKDSSLNRRFQFAFPLLLHSLL